MNEKQERRNICGSIRRFGHFVFLYNLLYMDIWISYTIKYNYLFMNIQH